MKPMKTMISVLAMSAIAGTAAAGDFGTIDADANGQIDFKEYKTYAMQDGKTSTLAAQEFASMSQGDAVVSEDEFLTAELGTTATLDKSLDVIAEPVELEIEATKPAEIIVETPQIVEVMPSEGLEPPADTSADLPLSVDDTAPDTDMSWEEAPSETLADTSSESMTSATEVEIESEVKGEVVTSDNWTLPNVTVPEIIVPEMGVETEMELDLEADAELESELEDDIIVPAAPELPVSPVVD